MNDFFHSLSVYRNEYEIVEVVATFSHLSGERLYQIYSKLKLEHIAAGFGPSHPNGSVSSPFGRNGKLSHSYSFPGSATPQRIMSNGIQPLDPNSMGILGAGPSEKCTAGEKQFKTRYGGFPPRQEFSSGIE